MWGLGCMVYGLWFRMRGSKFRIWVSGFEFQPPRLTRALFPSLFADLFPHGFESYQYFSFLESQRTCFRCPLRFENRLSISLLRAKHPSSFHFDMKVGFCEDKNGCPIGAFARSLLGSDSQVLTGSHKRSIQCSWTFASLNSRLESNT